jgi:hypothetical protein
MEDAMTKIIETGILLIIILMAGCGGGGDGSAPVNTLPSNVGAGRVSITAPAYDGKSASATISGDAFISPTWWGCNPNGCVSGVTVTSQNLATGFISTVQPKMSCVLSLCDNTWSSTLPLAVGSNSILVSASDPSGNIGYASCTLVRGN